MKKPSVTPDATRRMTEVFGLTLLFLAVFLTVSLATFSPHDPSVNQAVSAGRKIHNLVGVAGAYASGLLVDVMGGAAWCVSAWLFYLAATRFVLRWRIKWWRWLGLVPAVVCAMVWLAMAGGTDILSGGLGGDVIYRTSRQFLRPAGTVLLWSFVTLLSIYVSLGVSLGSVGKRILSILKDFWLKFLSRWERRSALARERKAAAEARKREQPDRKETRRKKEKAAVGSLSLDAPPATSTPPSPASEPEPESVPVRQKPAAKTKPKQGKGELSAPDIDFLTSPPANLALEDPKNVQERAERLSGCLSDFNIQGEIVSSMPGPVVTMFEFRPAPGVKVSRIAGLADDIALALKALAVRIEAPIPGRDTVGVEIPNEKRQVVYLREILESEAFGKQESKLTMALGKDIHGRPQVADLAKMPHLLVAGATGAGKSVCLNSLLVSFLYKADPDSLKLLLVDPKRIELAVYADLPHLVHPVVTDMAMAKSALDWAVHEMDRRYESMAQLGVRNILGYNKKLSELGDKRPEGLEELQAMPYLVIIIDELADLMMTQGKDVEASIVRLAQLARAAGIHIILATQRPSVDVVTGLIKANFPTRISFQVTSKHDSRTILDMVGAEKLLGRGDMLFKPGGAKLKRIHGTFVDEDEIARVVGYWKDQRQPEFELDFSNWSNGGGNGDPSDVDVSSDDPMYREAVDFVLQQGKASISLLQRRFRIGFNRAARYIEQMEQDGLLGPQEGSKPRTVIGGGRE
ncbi:MAG: segregation ATPase FtsK/SpoIIIE, family [Desulfovibrionales bacterium]|nr:segregation ATPase FtsK/SpoIIIE, family [Desulfovibrionales bacterium]